MILTSNDIIKLEIMNEYNRQVEANRKHLVIRYFDCYLEKEYYFDTEEEAREFEQEQNKNRTALTEYMYRGKV